MSNHDDFYQPPVGNNNQPFQDNNPFHQGQQEQNAWQGQHGNTPQGMQVPHPGGPPSQNIPPYSSGEGYSQQNQNQQYQGFEAPPGPPPGQHGQQPRRSATFKESDFVPEGERGEQREAMEQFEMNKGAQTEEDRDLEMLQREFPSVDGSLVAALYGDSKNLAATREMLRELGSQT